MSTDAVPAGRLGQLGGEKPRVVDASSISPLHDPASMREVLQRHLVQAEASPLRITECRIANTRRRDGARGAVEYELTLLHPSTGQSWEQRVSGITFGGGRTRRAWDSLRQSSTRAIRNGAASGLLAFAYVPELDLLLQVFPHDHRLPALAELIAGPPPNVLSALLAEFGDGTWRLSEWSAEPVQYRVDMRAIVLLSVGARTPDGAFAARQFYAKIYRDADAYTRAFATQGAVSARAVEGSGLLVAARAIGQFDERRTLVTEALSGTSLSKIIRRGESSAPAVQAAARAVAEFHQLEVEAPARQFADEVTRLREAEAFLVSERPDLADLVSAIAQTVIAGLADGPRSLLHGDLKPDHILVDGDRVGLIDFDLSVTADPVSDVAHLIAFLAKPQERARNRRDDPLDAAAVFVEEYFAHVPSSWRERLPTYHALTAIHKAVGLCRRRGAGGQGRLEDVLREGQAFLDGTAHASVPTFKRRMTRTAARPH